MYNPPETTNAFHRAQQDFFDSADQAKAVVNQFKNSEEPDWNITCNKIVSTRNNTILAGEQLIQLPETVERQRDEASAFQQALQAATKAALDISAQTAHID